MPEDINIDYDKCFDFVAYVHMQVTIESVNNLTEKQCDEFMIFFNKEFDGFISECCQDFLNKSYL